MDCQIIPGPLADDPSLDSALTFAWEGLSTFGISIPEHSDVFVFFNSLGGMLAVFGDERVSTIVGDVMRHVNYLAEKAGCQSADLLCGGAFDTERQIVLDALCNIGGVLRTAPHRQLPPDESSVGIQSDVLAPIVEVALTGYSFSDAQHRTLDHLGETGLVLRRALEARLNAPPPGIPADVFALILEAEAKLAGWCSREKALAIARTVLQERPKTCVEIGVFGGRSLVPCAAALRHIGAGEIYGIEAWSPAVAVENVTNAVNDDWWSKIDFAHVKQEFYRFVAAADLTRHVRLVEAPSARAVALFDAIDFLHIDGAHSMINAAEDVILYARKVRRGGIVVFDDVNWTSTAPALELLGMLCDTLTMLKDPNSGRDICAVLRRR
jgi:predicted O-methyltransferase YrrM